MPRDHDEKAREVGKAVVLLFVSHKLFYLTGFRVFYGVGGL